MLTIILRRSLLFYVTFKSFFYLFKFKLSQELAGDDYSEEVLVEAGMMRTVHIHPHMMEVIMVMVMRTVHLHNHYSPSTTIHIHPHIQATDLI